MTTEHSPLRILVSSDNHLGYKEKDHIRSQDSFQGFEEVLAKARKEQADLILLGGDLFDVVNPSPASMHKAYQIFNRHIFGDPSQKETFSLEKQSQEGVQTIHRPPHVDLPVLIVHGNHDYPAEDFGSLSCLDLLHQANFLNYFGKHSNYDKMVVHPMLIKKGNTRVAIYGIGHIKDVRLHFMFEENKIEFVRPHDEKQGKNYFKILVVHQNRFKGARAGASYKNCIHFKMLPRMMDLIIWGHEHESIPMAHTDVESGLTYYQPGSTVATSLIPAEGLIKHCGMLLVNKQQFDITPFYLTDSHRAIICRNIDLLDLIRADLSKNKDVHTDALLLCEDTKTLEKVITKEFKNCLKEYDQYQYKNEKKPLIRFKILDDKFDYEFHNQLENKFSKFVANPQEVLKYGRHYRSENEIKKPITEDFEQRLRDKVPLNIISKSNYEESLCYFLKHVQNQRLSFNILQPHQIFSRNQFCKPVEFSNKIHDQYFNVKQEITKELLSKHEKIREEVNKLIEQGMEKVERQKEQLERNEKLVSEGDGLFSHIEDNYQALDDRKMADMRQVKQDILDKTKQNAFQNYDNSDSTTDILKKHSSKKKPAEKKSRKNKRKEEDSSKVMASQKDMEYFQYEEENE